MTSLNRRAFGSSAVAALAALKLPVPAVASATFDVKQVSKDLRWFVQELIEANRKFQLADAAYGQEKIGRPLSWGKAYGDLLEAHYDLQKELTDDTPSVRAVRNWCHRLAPRPCQQALAFWTRIPHLSRPFAALRPNILIARANYALARYQFRTRYPLGLPMSHRDSDDFNVCISAYERVADAWFAVRQAVMESVARNPSDRELSRRMLQAIVTDEIIDVPYLRTVLPQWKLYPSKFLPLRRCGHDCPDCERLLGRRNSSTPISTPKSLLLIHWHTVMIDA